MPNFNKFLAEFPKNFNRISRKFKPNFQKKSGKFLENRKKMKKNREQKAYLSLESWLESNCMRSCRPEGSIVLVA